MAAKRFWVRKEKSRIVEWQTSQPTDYHRWEARRMIAGGMAFRRQKGTSDVGQGLTVYKGENIIAREIRGDPVAKNIDPNKVSDASLWSYADILPVKGFAIA